MHYAAKYGQIVVMQYLNLKNVNIAAKNQMGWTPFHQVRACLVCHAEIEDAFVKIYGSFKKTQGSFVEIQGSFVEI